MKHKLLKTNVVRLLDKQKVAYTLHTYEWHVLNAQMAECVYKTIVLISKNNTIYVCVIPLQSMIDLKKVALLCQEKQLSLLPLDDLERHTGYIRGGCSPIGMKKHYVTLVDDTIQTLSTVIVSAGKQGVQVELDTQTFVLFTKAKIASLIV